RQWQAAPAPAPLSLIEKSAEIENCDRELRAALEPWNGDSRREWVHRRRSRVEFNINNELFTWMGVHGMDPHLDDSVARTMAVTFGRFELPDWNENLSRSKEKWVGSWGGDEERAGRRVSLTSPCPRPFEIAELFSRLNVSLRPPGIALR
ncbi:hypothetical protein V1478_018389, partial [Vespula squamosa]